MIDIYVFSSSNITNLWAGIGAGQWAVSLKQAENKSIRTKSQRMSIGSFGLFYCVETSSLTSPFVTLSRPSMTSSVKGVWDEEWQLPFLILPLANPKHQIRNNALMPIISAMKGLGKAWNQIFYVTPTLAFTPSKLEKQDWEALLLQLVPQGRIEGAE